MREKARDDLVAHVVYLAENAPGDVADRFLESAEATFTEFARPNRVSTEAIEDHPAACAAHFNGQSHEQTPRLTSRIRLPRRRRSAPKRCIHGQHSDVRSALGATQYQETINERERRQRTLPSNEPCCAEP